MKPVKVKGQIFWSRHNEAYDDGRFGVDIGQLSQAAVVTSKTNSVHQDITVYQCSCIIERRSTHYTAS